MRRRVIAIVFALVLALLGAVGALTYAQAADSRAVAGQQLVSVYISRAAVPAGTTIQDAIAKSLMTPEPVVAKGVPQGALAKPDGSTSSLVALTEIAAGEIVLAARFGSASQATTNSVPAGTVAVTVKLEDPQRIAPLLTPGSHIVLYDTFNPANSKAATLVPNGGKLAETPSLPRATRVVLSDVTVLAVGSSTASSSSAASVPAEQSSPESSALVTVAVSPADALVLVHAVQTGTLYAALRGADVTVDAKASVTDNTVLTGR